MLLGADIPSGGLDPQLQPLPGPGREEGGLRWAGGRLLTDCPCPTGGNVCKPQGPLASQTCSQQRSSTPYRGAPEVALGGAGCGCVCSKGMAGGRARDWSSASVPATAFCTVLALTSELLLLSHLPSPPTGPWPLDGLSMHFIYLQSVFQAAELLQNQRNQLK